MSAPILAIRGAGLACPLGLHGPAVMAAMAAGITRFELLPEEDATLSRLRTLDPSSDRVGRMVGLARYAIGDVARGATWRWPASVPLLLALPDPGAGDGAAYDERSCVTELRREITAQTGAVPWIPPDGVVYRGRAGLLCALRRAAETIQGEGLPLALVGAVDSLVDHESVRALARQGLLQGQANLDGRILSEAATLLSVSRADGAAGGALAQVLGIEEGEAEDSFAQVQQGAMPLTARGLTSLFHRLRQVFPHRVGGVFSAQPGEGFWGREFSYGCSRASVSLTKTIFK